jgi:hypothetical protein
MGSLNLADTESTKVSFRLHKNFKSSVEEVVNLSCFSLGKIAYDGSSLFLGDYTLWDLAKNRLVADKVTSAVSAVREMMEFNQSGYPVNDEMIAAVLSQIVESPVLLTK